MAGLLSNMSWRIGCTGKLLRQSVVAGVFAYFAAFSALAQTPATTANVAVTVTLLPSYTDTTAPAAEAKKGDLNVVAAVAGLAKASSWLYFDARALPAGVNVTSARLQLIPKDADDKAMTITVAPQKASADGKTPLNLHYSESVGTIVTWVSGAKFDVAKKGAEIGIGSAKCTIGEIRAPTSLTCKEDFGRQNNVTATLPAVAVVNTYPDTASRRTLRSAPILTKEEMEDRSDFANVRVDDLLQSEGEGKRKYIGLLLLPQGSASRRVYYGLNASPNQLPRLIVTYSRPAPKVPGCASEPSALAAFQSDGRMADSSSCAFMPTTNKPANGEYTLRPIDAAWTLTQAPVVYGDGLFVVQEVGSETRLIELNPLGGVIGFLKLGDKGAVILRSLMVVDRFGRIRIITNNAIFDVQVGPDGHLPAKFDENRNKKLFPFEGLPKAVVPGPDGTLYIVKQGIFALNPDVEGVDPEDKKFRPRKLWQVGIFDEDKARLTLGPDGHFLYALATVGDGKGGERSRLMAINAQTGEDVELLPGGVTAFPDDLKSFRNPVVARGSDGVDFIYVTGNSGSGATLMGASNTPATENGRLVGHLTGVWRYPLGMGSDVGQPILDPEPPLKSERGPVLSQKKLYFLQLGGGESKLTAVLALNGEKVKLTPGTALPAKIGAYGSPVVDSAGNVAFWADSTFYGLAPDQKPLPLSGLNNPQLMFGPGGTLYAVYQNPASQTAVSAVVPSFQQSDIGPTDICSPTNLYVTGNTARQGGKAWTLAARGSMILGVNFLVKADETLAVSIKACK